MLKNISAWQIAMHLVSAHVYKGLQTYIQMLDLSTRAIMIMTRERVKKLKELYICHLPPEIMEMVLMACAGNFNSVFNQHSTEGCVQEETRSCKVDSIPFYGLPHQTLHQGGSQKGTRSLSSMAGPFLDSVHWPIGTSGARPRSQPRLQFFWPQYLCQRTMVREFQQQCWWPHRLFQLS